MTQLVTLDKDKKNNNISATCICKLLGLLVQIKKKPDTGWGETKIVWRQGHIATITVTATEEYEVSNQNQRFAVSLDKDAHQNQ